MAKLEQGTDVEITTSSSGGRSKHILKLTGRRRGPREAVAQGSARAAVGEPAAAVSVTVVPGARAYRVAP